MTPRTGAQIQAQILNYLQTNYGQIGQPFYYYFNDSDGNPLAASMTAIVGIIITCMSWAIAFFEQLNSQFLTMVETQVANAPVFCGNWIQWMILTFQYSTTNPQFRNLNTTTFAITYPTINNSLNVISQASVQNLTNRSLYILVASGSPPQQTSAPVIAALESDMKIWMIPGTAYIVQSYNADQIYIQAQVFYNAAYSGVVQTNMNAAISAYLSGINFAGVFSVGALYDAMSNVLGVTNVILNNVYWRKATDTPPAANPPTTENVLVSGNNWINSTYPMFAGYAITETTSGYTPSDTITYTAD